MENGDTTGDTTGETIARGAVKRWQKELAPRASAGSNPDKMEEGQQMLPLKLL